jgi:cysteine desulfurase/selenocysteine lyase
MTDEAYVSRESVITDGFVEQLLSMLEPVGAPAAAATRVPGFATAGAGDTAMHAAPIRSVTGLLPAPGTADPWMLPIDSQGTPDPNFYFLPSPNSVDDMGGGDVDGDALRRDFPVLQQEIHGKRLIWLDNAATTQKPRSVIDAVSRYYERDNSNVHRGAHTLAARATDAYEAAREKVQRFIGASTPNEIVFVRGATEALNLVAQSIGRQQVGAGDEIVLTTLEHHANIVPWQMLAKEKGARLRVVPIDDRGQVLLDEYRFMLSPRTRIVALAHVSNALGTVLPIDVMAQIAHSAGAIVVVDGAQAVSHMPVDVREIDADFYAFSGHKLFGPTGVGVLYGKEPLLESMPPWQGGGSMIKDVTFDATVYNDAPYKFEAGTPTIGDAVGLGAAIDYVNSIGMVRISRHEQELMAHLTDSLSSIPGLTQIGTTPGKVGVASFVVDWMSPEEMARALDREGIAVRAGHHCAQPALRRYGLEATVRPSLALYNTHEDIECLEWAIRQTRP